MNVALVVGAAGVSALIVFALHPLIIGRNLEIDRQPGYCTSMTRSRLVIDRLENFPHSGIDTIIPLPRKIRKPFKSLTDLTRQLMQYPG